MLQCCSSRKVDRPGSDEAPLPSIDRLCARDKSKSQQPAAKPPIPAHVRAAFDPDTGLCRFCSKPEFQCLNCMYIFCTNCDWYYEWTQPGKGMARGVEGVVCEGCHVSLGGRPASSARLISF
eukprot:JP448482.1.p1 GENE.JP448482.1~~JP448482.1.p1  ORF type:complete len:122 (+),score=5.85 JP448482.1:15-380(+)